MNLNPARPFTHTEQALLRSSIRDLRARFRGKSWKHLRSQYPYLAAVPGIRERIFPRRAAAAPRPERRALRADGIGYRP